MFESPAREEPRGASRRIVFPSPLLYAWLPPIATIEERIRARTDGVDHLDRIVIRRLAIEIHIVGKATEYVEDASGLIEDVDGPREKNAPLLGEIRKRDDSIVQELKTSVVSMIRRAG